MNRSWKFFLFILLSISLLAGINQNLWAVSYNVIDLTPSDYNNYVKSYDICSGQQVGYGIYGNSGKEHALLWNGSAQSYVDLHPSGFDCSIAGGTNGTQQVGSGSVPYPNDAIHALLWSGSAQSYVDLHPGGFGNSSASSISGAQQVGSYNSQAALWTGSAQSYVNLNPSGYSSSSITDTNGLQQVGWGNGSATGYQGHAILWNSSADNYVDLHPSGYIYPYSVATGISPSGNQQVGITGDNTGYITHALLWTGSAQSLIDLNTIGYCSKAYDTNGEQQVGWMGQSQFRYHAFVWNGTAGSGVDIHQFLPSEFNAYNSEAYSIDSQGNITGYVLTHTTGIHAVIWVPVPEPGTVGMLIVCALSLGLV